MIPAIITFTFSEVPLDRCCWEWVHYGHCPRPLCRWPHSFPVPYQCRLSIHMMGEMIPGCPSPTEAMENKSSCSPSTQELSPSQMEPMRPMSALSPENIVGGTGVTPPCPSEAGTIATQEAELMRATPKSDESCEVPMEVVPLVHRRMRSNSSTSTSIEPASSDEASSLNTPLDVQGDAEA